jgi:hypothetical protein
MTSMRWADAAVISFRNGLMRVLFSPKSQRHARSNIFVTACERDNLDLPAHLCHAPVLSKHIG